MSLLAASLVAIVTALTAATVIPDGVSLEIEPFHGGKRVIACDYQFTTFGAFFRRFITDQNTEARAGMQCCREWIVDQSPMLVPAAEGNARHMQVAIADIADGDCALTNTACLHASDAG